MPRDAQVVHASEPQSSGVDFILAPAAGVPRYADKVRRDHLPRQSDSGCASSFGFAIPEGPAQDELLIKYQVSRHQLPRWTLNSGNVRRRDMAFLAAGEASKEPASSTRIAMPNSIVTVRGRRKVR